MLTTRKRRFSLVLAAIAVLLGSLVAFVQPSVWAAPPRCNVDVKGWPDCIPKREDFVRALHAAEDATFFWSGSIGGPPPSAGGTGHSVIDRAAEIAQLYGGTTLERALQDANVGMPEFTDVDPQGNRIAEYYEGDDQYLVNSAWTTASQVLANQARGLVYVVIGDWQRSNNVFDGTGDPEAGVEVAALRNNPAVWGIVRVNPTTLEETPYWHRDGYTDYEMMRYANSRRVARACPVMQQQNFPRPTVGVSTTIATPAPPAPPVSFHPQRIGSRLFNGTSVYWPIGRFGGPGHYTTEWAAVPSPTPLTYDNARLGWMTYHHSFSGAGTTGTPSTYTLNASWVVSSTAHSSHVMVVPKIVGCRPPRDELKKRDLRVMPLGDSITYGIESSDGNGYRDKLHQLLVAGAPTAADTTASVAKAVAATSGSSVDFVGSQSGGSMADKQNEGHPGWRIDQVADVAKCTVPLYRPNVITLHVGTNDANQNYRIDTAGQRVKALIDQALKDSPKATVVVSQIIPTGKAGLEDRIDKINDAVAKVIEDEAAAGRHVIGAEQLDLRLTDGIQNDAHPTDAGYDKMAVNFYEAIEAAEDNGWIDTPDPISSTSQTGGTCKIKSETDDGTTALGTGWRKLGVIAPGMTRTAAYDRTEFADMNGDGRQDYVQIRKDGSIRVGINTPGEPGKPTWPDWLGTDEFLPSGGRAMVPLDPGTESVADQMRLADIDGDGRDDVVFVAGDGRMDAYMNIALTDTSPPGWTKMENFGPFKNVGRDHIRFADVNGDGRDDVLRVGDNGEVHAYFNNPGDPGVHGAPPKWTEKLSWAPGVKGASLANLRFADVNGDHKADYLMVGADGSVHAYLNKGGKDAGGFEAHMYWSNASNYPGRLVQFQDISGDGRADYLVVYAEGAVRAWLNRGGNL